MKNNNYKERTNVYSANDSAISFILALIVPQILIIIVAMICSNIVGLPLASADSNVETFEKTYPYAYYLICSLIPQISFIGVFFFISERRKVNYKKANQINFKLNPLIFVCVIAIGLVAMFGFSSFINLIDYFTTSLGYKSSASNVDLSTFWKFFASIFYIGLLPAICEELIFRGIITNGLKKFGTLAAVILSAVFFALMHQNLQQFVYQLFLGGVMAYIVIKTGSIVYTMILHFFNNFTILFMSYLTSETTIDYNDPKYAEYYSHAWNIIWPILLVIAAVGIIIGLLFLINYLTNKKKKAVQNCEVQSIQQTQVAERQEEIKPAKVEIQISEPDDNKLDDESPKIELEQTDKLNDKFLKNIYLILALVGGFVFWLFAIISSFK